MEIKPLFKKLNWEIDSLPLKATITFLNPYSYLLIRKSEAIKEIDFIGIDGVLLKRIFNLFLENKIERRSFDATSLAPDLYHYCQNQNKSIFFIGSTDDNINAFLEVIRVSEPELDIKGFRNGYFNSNEEKRKTIEEIVKINPDFVIVGMGSPHQEKFILTLKRSNYKGISFTCGGYFHQTTKRVDYYPKFYNKYNLRWVYRIIDEPKLFKRYFAFYPKSMIYIFYDLIRFKLKN